VVARSFPEPTSGKEGSTLPRDEERVSRRVESSIALPYTACARALRAQVSATWRFDPEGRDRATRISRSPSPMPDELIPVCSPFRASLYRRHPGDSIHDSRRFVPEGGPQESADSGRHRGAGPSVDTNGGGQRRGQRQFLTAAPRCPKTSAKRRSRRGSYDRLTPPRCRRSLQGLDLGPRASAVAWWMQRTGPPRANTFASLRENNDVAAGFEIFGAHEQGGLSGA